jgi:hypothetical protein
MSNGAKVAMAVGAGYMLGRTKKMRLALMLAAAGVTGKFPTSPTELVAHGLKSLGASADVSQLTEQLRGELLNAGRAAAIAAATSQVDAINDRLQGVTSAVAVDETLDDLGGTVSRVGRRRTRSEDDYVDEDEAYDEPDEDDDEEPLDVDEADEDMDEDEDDEDVEDVDEDEDLEEPDEEPEELEPPVTRRRAARRPSTPRKSVPSTKRAAARTTTRRGR